MSSAASVSTTSRRPLVWQGSDFLLRGGSLPLDEGQRRQRYRGLSVSVVTQLVMVALVMAGLAIGPRPIQRKMEPSEEQVLTYLVAPPPPVYFHPRPRPPVERRQPALRLATPALPEPPRMRPAVKVKLPVAPAVKLNERPPVLAAAAPPPPPPPPPTVKLGRFGAPHGIVAVTGQPVAVPRLGNFGAGEQADPPDPPPAARVGSAGFDGPARAGQRSGDAAGQVQSSGFGGPEPGDPAAAPPGAGDGGKIQLHSFAASAPVARAPTPAVAAPPPAEFTPPQILAWPTPVYTADARRNHIEGEVTVAVRLAADGTVTVLRLIQGLGHGLDENAEAAARQLSFRPARRRGQPVDWTVLVHIQFRLAN
ncbi:MAG: energy transducer TonB [Terriglobales bacterium]